MSKSLRILCSRDSVGPLTSDRAWLFLLSMGNLLFIYLSSQEGDHPSEELLKGHSKFYKFLSCSGPG